MYQLNEFETWREHRSDLLREAEEERLARRFIGSACPENKWSIPAVALGVLAVLMVAGLMLVAKPAHAANFTVNSTADPGSGVCNSTECTLREAIVISNLVDGPDIIRFNIAGEGVKTISPTSALPAITEAVTIDGYTQPGASLNTLVQGTNAQIKVELDGTAAAGSGLEIVADDVVVRGLAIGGFANGIEVDDAEALAAPAGVRIEGNFLGTAASGTAARPNRFNGLNLIASGGDNTIGGTSPARRNLISGNGANGVNTSGTTGVEVLGNLIGTDKSGTSPLANGGRGVRIGGKGNTVGDLDPSDGLTNAANIIAFNDDDGVVIEDPDNRVVRNVIFSNGEDGVGVSSDDDFGNHILWNSIFSNGRLGIDLVGGTEDQNGVTANDRRDRDSGANGLQNKPVVTSATTSDGESTIKGKLNSRPRKSFTLQFFFNPSGGDEGQSLVGQKTLKTNRKGNASFSFVASQVIPIGAAVTVTATGLEGTSEFSAPRTVVAG